jgi:hypothetical protein
MDLISQTGSNPVLHLAAMQLLAAELIAEGMRLKVVSTITGLKPRQVNQLATGIPEHHPQRGVIRLRKPEYYLGTRPGHPSLSANITSTAFLLTWLALRERLPENVHEGFLLLASYRTYKREVQRCGFDMALTIQEAWNLVRIYAKWGREYAEVSLDRCHECRATFLVRTRSERGARTQCPFCRKSAHFHLLAGQAAEASKLGKKALRQPAQTGTHASF